MRWIRTSIIDLDDGVPCTVDIGRVLCSRFCLIEILHVAYKNNPSSGKHTVTSWEAGWQRTSPTAKTPKRCVKLKYRPEVKLSQLP